jgi:hypothetical protein
LSRPGLIGSHTRRADPAHVGTITRSAQSALSRRRNNADSRALLSTYVVVVMYLREPAFWAGVKHLSQGASWDRNGCLPQARTMHNTDASDR